MQAAQPHHVEIAVHGVSDNPEDVITEMQIPSTFTHQETISEGQTPRTSSKPIAVDKSHHLLPANVFRHDSAKESLSNLLSLSCPEKSNVRHRQLVTRTGSDGIPLLPPQVRRVRTLHTAAECDDRTHTSITNKIAAMPHLNLRRSRSESHLMDLAYESIPDVFISDQDENPYATPASPLSYPADTPVYSYVSPEDFTLSHQDSQPDKQGSFLHNLSCFELQSNENPSVSSRQSQNPNKGMNPSDMATKPPVAPRVRTVAVQQGKLITSETAQNCSQTLKTVTSENKYTNLRRSRMDPEWQATYQCTSRSRSTSSDHTDQSVSSPRPERESDSYENSDQCPMGSSPYGCRYMRLQGSTRIASTGPYQLPDFGQSLRKSERNADQSHSDEKHQGLAEEVTEQLYDSLVSPLSDEASTAGLVESDAEYDHHKKLSKYDHLRDLYQ